LQSTRRDREQVILGFRFEKVNYSMPIENKLTELVNSVTKTVIARYFFS